MKRTAVVKFIGNQENYRLGCGETEWKYCRDCDSKKCFYPITYQFISGQLYNAYFLEYWQGDRTSLHVKGEDGKVDDFNPIEEFEIVSDDDDVLNRHEAIVRCVTHSYDAKLFDLNYGREYKAIGYNKDGLLLVMDESFDCYFYPRKAFEIISDKYAVLDITSNDPIYDWENTFIESV